MADELQSLKAKLARREKTIANLNNQLQLCQGDLKELGQTIRLYKDRIEAAKQSMLLFLGLENLEKEFLNKVEEEFAVVRTKSHWEDW